MIACLARLHAPQDFNLLFHQVLKGLNVDLE